MKNIRNKSFLFALALGGAVLLTGCREDEELDLMDYPASQVGITIADAQDAAAVTLKAVYDVEGKIGVDGELTRQYIFAVDTPCTTDIVLQIEPVIVNIPAEKVEISAKEIRIPVGSRTAEAVEVKFLDDDFSFAEPDLEARTYELGVKIVGAQGQKMEIAGAEAKVIVDKAAYIAGGSLTGAEGSSITFNRSYWDGKILNEEKMEYAFKAYLDRPAAHDVKVTFSTSGLSEQFAGDVTVTPSELIIPAGALESTQEAVWSLTDDFLLTTDEPEEHAVQLTASFTSDDPTVQPLEKQSTLTFTVKKVFNALKLQNNIEDSWSMFDRTGWTATGEGGYGDASTVLDGSMYSDYYGMGPTLMVNIDMQENRSVVGLVIRYYAASYASKRALVEMSPDGENWTELGTLSDMPGLKEHFIKFLSPIEGRYVRFTSLEMNGYYHDISEIEVYGAK